jgi:hypothetical protein
MSTCVGAFVTFNNEESIAVCLANYRYSLSYFGRFFQRSGLRYRGEKSYDHTSTPIQVERAREPDDLRWENLEYDYVKRGIRRNCVRRSMLLTCLLLLVSFVFLLAVSKAPKVPLIVASFGITTGIVYIHYTHYIHSPFGITTVNDFLESLLYRCTDTEHHSSHSSYTTSISIKIFVSTFINTAIITLIIVGKLPNDVTFPLAPLGVFGGKIDEFNRAWYTAVGESLMLTMFLNAIEPNVMPLCDEAWYAFDRWRKTVQGGFSSQRQMNMLYAPTEAPMEERYALILNTVFCCLFFSPGLPIMWLFGAFSMAMIYANDRWVYSV